MYRQLPASIIREAGSDRTSRRFELSSTILVISGSERNYELPFLTFFLGQKSWVLNMAKGYVFFSLANLLFTVGGMMILCRDTCYVFWVSICSGWRLSPCFRVARTYSLNCVGKSIAQTVFGQIKSGFVHP